MTLHSLLKRLPLPRPALLTLALVVALGWSVDVLAHDGHAAQSAPTPHAGMTSDADALGQIVAAFAGEESGHESHRHHDDAGPHGSGKCSFGCSASILGAGQDGLPRPAARLARSGLEEAHLCGMAFRPPERPPRILG